MIRRRRKKRVQDSSTELNIMPFMNLMVILLPFLLITAVFSRTAVLELTLPGASAGPENPQEQLALEVTVRRDRIEVGDRTTGLLTELPSDADGYDLEGLGEYLMQVKTRFPHKVDATLLVESDVNYDAVVHVMDAMRSIRVVENGFRVTAELFPEIAIGDAVSARSLAATGEEGS